MEDLHTFYTNVVWHFDLTMFYMSKCQTWRLFQERIDSVIYLTFKTDYWSFLSASSPTKWPPEIDSLSVFYLLSVAFLSQKSNTITYPQPKSYWMIDRTLNDQFMAWYYLWPLKYRKRSLVPQVVSHRLRRRVLLCLSCYYVIFSSQYYHSLSPIPISYHVLIAESLVLFSVAKSILPSAASRFRVTHFYVGLSICRYLKFCMSEQSVTFSLCQCRNSLEI